ncbi:uncharacterized protein EI90DRAFT_2964283 [Cantharellus anzutake]|uniref:uncharacterized protein n=1 Tax=Cantharellus anzutake TaxID=1750568 RepID=UPI0019085C79|nr:uncharacterized protein EI90DRAFT_2964283 [Cantharellus anzutake]KAF8344351.1 hypothetical protein EI90DRAFT_2964283 [Cantharellus anzutake]
MSLLRIEETDEDVNSVHHPVSRDAFTSSEAFPQSTHGVEQVEDESLESFFETEFGLNVLQAIDPIEDNDSTNLATSTQHPPLGRTLTTFSKFSLVSAFSTFSNGSVLSFRSTGAIYPLEDLCDRVIDKHMWLQMARIVSTSCYSQYRNFVLHRFLIFRLYRPEKKDIWLRIDRKAGSTILSLVRKGGKTRANDTAQLSASEKDLIGKARRENQQIFDKPPFLGDFSDYLRVICDELREYKVWPDNCWMFCSLLQEHLGISGDGHYAFGGPVVPNTAPLVRTRISERAVVHVTPCTVSHL